MVCEVEFSNRQADAGTTGERFDEVRRTEA
jgi:hypothetical protein